MSELCRRLHNLFTTQPHLNFLFDPNTIPKNGIYVLFEKGERAHGIDRIVNVGTHTGQDRLRKRLEQHLLNEKKDLSILRKNVGRALLNQQNDPFLEQWEWGMVSRAEQEKYGSRLDRTKLAETEKRVTGYMQQTLHFCVWKVNSAEQRSFWKSKIVSTIFDCDECAPSAYWLGSASPVQKIRESGLWQVNDLENEPMTEREFDKLAAIVAAGRK